jgi:DNA-binding PucR family transcriptional regulator
MIGVGSLERSPSTVSTSRAQADQVLRVLRSENRTGVAEISEVTSKVLLLKMSESLAHDPRLLSKPIKVLRQLDVENRTDYLATLDAYLKAFGAVDEAAKQVHVHANTVRYRLKQIQNLTGLDLSDPDERLALAIQLRLANGAGERPALS